MRLWRARPRPVPRPRPGERPAPRVIVVGVVIDEAGRALVIQRRDNGRWEPPGGRLDMGEQVLAGLVREVEEETGVQAAPVRATGIYHNVSRGVVALVFRCRHAGGEARTTDEAAAVRWVTPDEARELMSEAYGVRVLDAYRDDGPHVRDHDGPRLL